MSVSALCVLALKAFPSPPATFREYSMNHDHVASTSLPNSFTLLPRCIPSPASASSLCPPANTISAHTGERQALRPAFTNEEPRRHIIVKTVIAELTEWAGGANVS